MPIAGVGRVEPMDPDVKREVVRRARESGTFATDADATESVATALLPPSGSVAVPDLAHLSPYRPLL